MPRLLSIAFAAGAFGALVSGLFAWACGYYGLFAKAGVAMAPALGSAWMYSRIVLGGLWALLMVLPVTRQPVVLGLFLSLGPTLFQLLWIYPFVSGHGLLGSELGFWTPAVVWGLNLVWAYAAVLWSRAAGY